MKKNSTYGLVTNELTTQLIQHVNHGLAQNWSLPSVVKELTNSDIHFLRTHSLQSIVNSENIVQKNENPLKNLIFNLLIAVATHLTLEAIKPISLEIKSTSSENTKNKTNIQRAETKVATINAKHKRSSTRSNNEKNIMNNQNYQYGYELDQDQYTSEYEVTKDVFLDKSRNLMVESSHHLAEKKFVKTITHKIVSKVAENYEYIYDLAKEPNQTGFLDTVQNITKDIIVESVIEKGVDFFVKMAPQAIGRSISFGISAGLEAFFISPEIGHNDSEERFQIPPPKLPFSQELRQTVPENIPKIDPEYPVLRQGENQSQQPHNNEKNCCVM